MLFLLLTAFAGFDRIYLNAHWLSDVIGDTLGGPPQYLSFNT